MEITQTQSTSTSIAWQYKHNVEVTPKGLTINRAIGSTSATTSQYPHINQILLMQCLRIGTNAQKLGLERV